MLVYLSGTRYLYISFYTSQFLPHFLPLTNDDLEHHHIEVMLQMITFHPLRIPRCDSMLQGRSDWLKVG